MDINNDSRTKACDLYDANFIIKNYPNAVSDNQIINILNINMDDLEARYKDLSIVILELSEVSEQTAQDRKLGQYKLDDGLKIDVLRNQLTKDTINKDYLNNPTMMR